MFSDLMNQIRRFPQNYHVEVIWSKREYLDVDPVFRLMRFPLDGELRFYFEKFDFIDYKMTWSRHLFLFYF